MFHIKNQTTPLNAKPRRGLSISTLAVAITLIGSASALACGPKTPCPVPEGSYLVRTPAGWDGKSAMPALFFFHGYEGSARQTMSNRGYKKVADRYGLLLVAADGKNNAWSYPGLRFHNRDDFKYTIAVRTDVLRRFPVQTDAMLVSGHSLGGSMAWYIACFMGPKFTAYAPIAGAYWRPHPTSCPGGPVHLRHIHGLNDRTVPMKGRSFRNGAIKQGDVRESMAALVKRNACPVTSTSKIKSGPLTCAIWPSSNCTSRKEALLCLHPGGHGIKAQWLADAFVWMKSLPRAQASR